MDLANNIRTVSLFSGCGGLDIGFFECGFKTIIASDNWQVACDTLAKNNMAEQIICDDTRNISFTSLLGSQKPIDCVIGGPPCPPYSQTRHYLTKKKKGLADEAAGFAIPEFFRAVRELNPKVFMLENVDGFLYKTHREAFEYLAVAAEELDYKIFYKVINCANYGVPQTRKRFFCIGSKKLLPNFEFPEETHGNAPHNNLKLPWVTCADVISDYDYITDEEKQQRPGSKDHDLFLQIPPGDNYLYYTAKRGHTDPKFKWKSRYWTFLLKLSPNRPSWTIQASLSNNQGPFHWKNRFLRIEEIKRLQTFPDDYEICGDFKEQWRQIGNAVPPLMAKIIASKIREVYFSE